MEFIKSEMQKEFNALNFKNLRRNVKELPQTPVKNLNRKIDASRHALRSGKRISKTGKVYWETRQNRSDKKGSNI